MPELRLGLSKQASVVSIVPSPFPSMAPPSRIMPGVERRFSIELFGDARGSHIVEIERRILAAPGVVAPIENNWLEAHLLATEKRGAVITAPGIIGRNIPKRDVRQMADETTGPTPSSLRRRRGCSPARTGQAFLRDRRKGAGTGSNLLGPCIAIVGPRKPSRGMRLPLGGPAVTLCARACRG